jgi:RimJ/RimL family protein N-acetyltransferase
VLYTHEFEKNYLEKVASNADKSSCMLAFVRKKDNQIIGSGGFFGIDTLNRNAELGILIGDERLHGKGYGTEGIRLLLEYGFTMLNLHMIYLNYLSFNKRGEKLYEKCGFRHAGKLREARIIGNQKYDLIMMDILASEYQSDFLEKILAPPAVS